MNETHAFQYFLPLKLLIFLGLFDDFRSVMVTSTLGEEQPWFEQPYEKSEVMDTSW